MSVEKPAAYNNLGLSYFEQEDYEQAIENYNKAILIDPSATHLNNRGLARYQNDDIEDAKYDFNQAIQQDPNDANIYFNRGNVYLNWKPEPEFKLAHDDYDRAIEMQPNNAKILHQKGLAYQRQSEFIQEKNGELDPQLDNMAISMFKKCLKFNPNFISSQHHLGVMYHRTRQYHNALKCYSLVLEKVDKDKTVYLARGQVYQDMENHQLAIVDFDNVIKYDPKLAEGYYRRGWSKFFLRRFMDAIVDFKAAKEKEIEYQNKHNTSGDENWGILNGIGCCHHALKEY